MLELLPNNFAILAIALTKTFITEGKKISPRWYRGNPRDLKGNLLKDRILYPDEDTGNIIFSKTIERGLAAPEKVIETLLKLSTDLSQRRKTLVGTEEILPRVLIGEISEAEMALYLFESD